MAPADVMKEKLSFIYGPEVGQVAWAKLEPMLAQFKLQHPQLCSQVCTPTNMHGISNNCSALKLKFICI